MTEEKKYDEMRAASDFIEALDAAKPPRGPLTDLEKERLEQAKQELAKIAAQKTEDDRKALLEKALARRHTYRGVRKSGKERVIESYPDMMFLVVATDKDGNEIEYHCGSGTQALHCVKNARLHDGHEAELVPLELIKKPEPL